LRLEFEYVPEFAILTFVPAAPHAADRAVKAIRPKDKHFACIFRVLRD
jgi:hypothetical protein